VARAPSTEDLLVQLALHAAFQHGLSLSPIQYLDTRRLLAASPDFGRVFELSAAAHADRALAAALLATAGMTGASLPEPCRVFIERVLPASWLLRLADQADGGGPPVGLARFRWMLAAGHRWTLLRDTVSPDVPGVGRPGVRQILRRVSMLPGRNVA
jgi:hypothetical protein